MDTIGIRPTLVLQVDAGRKGNLELTLKEGEQPEQAVEKFCRDHNLGQKARRQLTAEIMKHSNRQLRPQGSLNSYSTPELVKRLYDDSIAEASILKQKLSKLKYKRDKKEALELTFKPKLISRSVSLSRSPQSLYHNKELTAKTEKLRNKILSRKQKHCTFTPKTNTR